MSKVYHSSQYKFRQREIQEKIFFVEIYISVKRTTIKDFDDQEIGYLFEGNIEIPEWFAQGKELI